MSDRFRILAIAAACAGIASLIVGAIALANMGAHLVALDARPANSAGRAFLIAGELVATAAFTLAALACLGLGEQAGLRFLAARVAAVLKLVVLAGLLVGYWHLWYFMLDLRGPDALSFPVIVLSGIQAVLLVLMALAGAPQNRQ